MKFDFRSFRATYLKLDGNTVSGIAQLWDVDTDNGEQLRFLPGSIRWTELLIPGNITAQTNHDGIPVGYVSCLKNTPEGLKVEVTLADTDRAQEVKSLIEQGVLSGYSVGVEVEKSRKRWYLFGAEVIEKALLFEVSFVRQNASINSWKYS